MASCTMGTGPVREKKWWGRGVDHPPPSTVLSWRVGGSKFLLLHYMVADFNDSK